METMHAAGRRRLPPVPRPAAAARTAGRRPPEDPRDVRPDDADDATEVIDTSRIAEASMAAEPVDGAPGGMAAADGGSGTAAAEGEFVGAEPLDRSATDTEQIETPRTDTPQSETSQAHTPPAHTPQSGTPQTDAPQTDAAETEAAQTEAPRTPSPQTETPQTGTLPDGVVPAGPEGPATAVADRAAAADEAAPAAGETEAAPQVPAPRSSGLEDLVVRTALEVPAGQDPEQHFVANLRASAPDFADAAGAQSAVVREAVPPARHRRARCRLVLRYADGSVADVTLLGPAGAPGQPSRHGFDRQILRWLGTGLLHDESCLVADSDAPGGVAVDLTAWVSAGVSAG